MSKYNIKGGGTYLDLEFYGGENWTIDFEMVDGEGTIVDLTSATIVFRVSSATATPATIMSRTVSDGITLTTATLGTCTLNVTAAQQSSASVVEGTRYLYECRVHPSSGVLSVQARGHLNVVPSLIG